MDESFLLKIALVVSVLGIIFLYLISTQIELNDTTIEKITSGSVEDKVSVTGLVTSVKQSGKTTFITLSQTNNVDVVVFSKDVNAAAGDNVKITGRVQDYNGKKEIIADRVEMK
jgi:DNA/RNA endonuclease YhcR with UshA esterase domain